MENRLDLVRERMKHYMSGSKIEGCAYQVDGVYTKKVDDSTTRYMRVTDIGLSKEELQTAAKEDLAVALFYSWNYKDFQEIKEETYNYLKLDDVKLLIEHLQGIVDKIESTS